MDSNQLLESFSYRFAASGVRKPGHVAKELLAHVFDYRTQKLHNGQTPTPPSSGQMMAIIRQLDVLAERIENGEDPPAVLNCPDF